MSTVIDADCILVLDRGRLVERGRHEELLAAGGLYARLYETQFRPQNGGGTG
jgi:ATP-binding cassette subfamily B protein